MFKLEILTSGSQEGNCAILDNGETTLMIDIGHVYGGWKRVENDLSSRGYKVEDIDHLLITHKHNDHTKMLNMLLKHHPKKSKVVHTTDKVALDIKDNNISERFDVNGYNSMALNAKNIIGSFEIIPRRLKHTGLRNSRVKECIGFEIYDTVNNKWILFATDTSSLDMFKNVGHGWDLVCVECNYTKKVLDINYALSSKTPRDSATFIRSTEDHLSEENLSEFLIDENITCQVIELHESYENKTRKFDRTRYSQILWADQKED